MARKSKLEGRLLAILDPRRNRRALTRLGVLIAAVVVAAVAIPLAMMGAAPSQPATTSANAPDGYVEVQIAIRDRQYAPGEQLDSGRFRVLNEFTWPVPADGKAGKRRVTSRDGTALDVAWSSVTPLPKREKGFVFENFVWSLPAPVVDPLNGDRRTFDEHRVARQAFTSAFSHLATPVGLGDAAHRAGTAPTPALVIRARWAEHDCAPAAQPASRPASAPHAGGWSKEVNGLRCRLLVTRHQRGDDEVFLEIHNASERVLGVPLLCGGHPPVTFRFEGYPRLRSPTSFGAAWLEYGDIQPGRTRRFAINGDNGVRMLAYGRFVRGEGWVRFDPAGKTYRMCAVLESDGRRPDIEPPISHNWTERTEPLFGLGEADEQEPPSAHAWTGRIETPAVGVRLAARTRPADASHWPPQPTTQPASAPATQPAGQWGKANNGVQARLQADKHTWAAGQTPTFKADIRNQGKGTYSVAQAQQLCTLELDGTRYMWVGVMRVRSSALPPGREYKDISIALTDNWVKAKTTREGGEMAGTEKLKLTPGKHSLRVIFHADGVGGGQENVVVESNAVQFEIAAEGVRVSELTFGALAFSRLGRPVRIETNWRVVEQVYSTSPGGFFAMKDGRAVFTGFVRDLNDDSVVLVASIGLEGAPLAEIPAGKKVTIPRTAIVRIDEVVPTSQPADDKMAVRQAAEAFLAAIRNKDLERLKKLSVGDVEGWQTRQALAGSGNAEPLIGWNVTHIDDFMRELQSDVLRRDSNALTIVRDVHVEGDFAATATPGPGIRRDLILVFKRTSKGWRFATAGNARGSLEENLSKYVPRVRAVKVNRPVGSKLGLRIAPTPPDLSKAELQSYMDWITTGKVGFWWEKDGRIVEIAGRMPQYAWLPVAAKLTTAPQLVTGEYNGQNYVLVSDKPGQTMLSGKGWGLTKVYATKDNQNRPAVGFELDRLGTILLTALTERNIGSALAVVVDGKIVSAPVVRNALGETGMITGEFNEKDIRDLVRALRTGMPPVPSANSGQASQPATQPLLGDFKSLGITATQTVFETPPTITIKADGTCICQVSVRIEDEMISRRYEFRLSQPQMQELRRGLAQSKWLTVIPQAGPMPTDTPEWTFSLAGKNQPVKAMAWDWRDGPYKELIHLARSIAHQERLMVKLEYGRQDGLQAWGEIRSHLEALRGKPGTTPPYLLIDYSQYLPLAQLIFKNLVQGQDEELRAAMALAVHFNQTSRIEQIARLRHDRNAHVRGDAATALAALAGPKAIGWLVEMIDNDQARLELLKMGEPALPTVVPLVVKGTHPNDIVSVKIVRTYLDKWEELPPPSERFIEAVREGLKNSTDFKDYYQRFLAKAAQAPRSHSTTWAAVAPGAKEPTAKRMIGRVIQAGPLQVGERIEVVVNDMSPSVVEIADDGAISLPELEMPVQAAGTTVQNLERRIASAYGLPTDPENRPVSVVVVRASSRRGWTCMATGKFVTGRRLPLNSAHHVVDDGQMVLLLRLHGLRFDVAGENLTVGYNVTLPVSGRRSDLILELFDESGRLLMTDQIEVGRSGTGGSNNVQFQSALSGKGIDKQLAKATTYTLWVQPSSSPATQPASAPARQLAGSTLSFRVAPAPSDLGEAELESYMDWLKAGRVGPWWEKELEWRGQLPSCMWLPVADAMANAGNLVTGEHKGRKYVLVSDKPGQTMTGRRSPEAGATTKPLPRRDKNAWGLEKVYATEAGSGRPAVGFEFDDRGTELFSAFTKANVGSAVAIIVDGEVVAAPKLMTALGRRGIIVGRFTIGDVRDLVRSLRVGMPPASESSPAPATQPASARELQQAAEKILRTRGRREDDTWDRLANLIEPGMTLKQVFAVFPPSVSAKTFWHGPSSTYTYKTTLELSQTERWTEVKLSQAPQGLAKERVLARPRVKGGPEPLEDEPATQPASSPAFLSNAASRPAEGRTQMIVHIVSKGVWRKAVESGSYQPPSLMSAGFVHCSTPQQVVGVANSNFRGKTGLVLLCIDPARLKAPVKYENLEGGTSLFPHIYGPLNPDAVVEILDFAPQSDGTFLLPAKLAAETRPTTEPDDGSASLLDQVRSADPAKAYALLAAWHAGACSSDSLSVQEEVATMHMDCFSGMSGRASPSRRSRSKRL